MLMLDQRDALFNVIRLRILNESPLFIDKIYLPVTRFPDLSPGDFESTNIFRQVIPRRYRIALRDTHVYLEPVILSRTEEKLLEVHRKPVAGLLVERISFADHGNPIAVTQRIFRGDRCRHFIKITQRKQAAKAFQ
jgi:GntR family transcriptional regulator